MLASRWKFSCDTQNIPAEQWAKQRLKSVGSKGTVRILNHVPKDTCYMLKPGSKIFNFFTFILKAYSNGSL